MTPKERAAMQQALEALESYSKSDYIKKQHPKRRANGEKAITAMREALADQAEQEPVGVVEGSGEWGIAGVLVAGVPIGTKLYAAPARTKDLTDDEIESIMVEQGDLRTIAFARAVIAAYKEKNK